MRLPGRTEKAAKVPLIVLTAHPRSSAVPPAPAAPVARPARPHPATRPVRAPLPLPPLLPPAPSSPQGFPRHRSLWGRRGGAHGGRSACPLLLGGRAGRALVALVAACRAHPARRNMPSGRDRAHGRPRALVPPALAQRRARHAPDTHSTESSKGRPVQTQADHTSTGGAVGAPRAAPSVAAHPLRITAPHVNRCSSGRSSGCAFGASLCARGRGASAARRATPA